MTAGKMEQPTPVVLSMDVDDTNEYPSEYRLRIGNGVKYLKVEPNTFTADELVFPVPSLPPLPYDDENWTVAQISHDSDSGNINTTLSNLPLAGVQNVWHEVSVNVLDLERTAQLTGCTFEAVRPWKSSPGDVNPHVIAKIARFEWEIPSIERETRAYQIFEQQRAADLAPRFLGHIREGSRIMGLLLERSQTATTLEKQT